MIITDTFVVITKSGVIFPHQIRRFDSGLCNFRYNCLTSIQNVDYPIQLMITHNDYNEPYLKFFNFSVKTRNVGKIFLL